MSFKSKFCYFVELNVNSCKKMSNVLGEYEVTVDAKGRFMFPTGFKKQLTEVEASKFVLSRGIEKCLSLYTMEQWKSVEAIVVKFNPFNKKAREFKRAFLNGATTIEPDAAGRILIPKAMLTHAGITKEMIMCGQVDKIELWDSEAHAKEMARSEEVMDSVNDETLGTSFMSSFD